MIQAVIQFILSCFSVFVKFLGSIEIDLFGFTFSFWSFVICSIIVLVFVTGIISVSKRAGSMLISGLFSARDSERQRTAAEERRKYYKEQRERQHRRGN